jgi:rhodanese-related sulfurtransferase
MSITNIDSATLKKWLENDEAIVIDVREPAENAAESIKGSTLIPLGEICKKSLPEINNKKLVIHCRSGKRSHTACNKILNEDPNCEIYNLEGGISAWIASGNKIQSSGKFFLPLDRQVQLTIGFGTLLGSLLGYFVNPLFFILSGFFGAGLCFAGITGFCGLAIFMAKMPWNKNVNQAGTSCNLS